MELHSDGWRRLFTGSALLASLGITAYALSYLVILTSFSPTIDFAPTRVRTGIDWFAVSQSAYLLVGSIAFLPVALMYAVHGFRERPYASVLGSGLVVTSVMLLVIGNVPVIAEQLYPGTLAAVTAGELLRWQQVESVTVLVFDLIAFVAFYSALLIFGQMSRHQTPMPNRLVTQSLAVFALAAGCLSLSPMVSLTLAAAAVLSVGPIPIMLAILVERPAVVERRKTVESRSAEPVGIGG